MGRTFFTICTAALAVVALAGCTAAAVADDTAAGRDLTDAEQVQVDQALELLVRDCMAAEGFRYVPVRVVSAEERGGSGYVLDDVGWAREHGYGLELADRVAEIQRGDPNHSYANALPEAERLRYSVALDGDLAAGTLTARLPGGGAVQTPRDSCFAQAKGELYGDLAAWFQAEKVATNLVGLYADDLVADERFAVQLSAWSDCMRAHGHDYPDPPALREDLPRLLDGLGAAEARTTERLGAVGVATCAVDDTEVVATAHALEGEYRGRLDQYQDDVAAYQRLQAVALENARRVLAR